MTTATLSLLNVKEMAKALLPHVSRDNVTPVLGGISLGGERHGQYAVASDRYTVGRFDLSGLLKGEPDGELWIPLSALYWASRLSKSVLIHDTSEYTVRFSTSPTKRDKDGKLLDPAQCVVTVWHNTRRGRMQVHLLRTFRALGADGVFPPVTRLFESFLPGEISRVGLSPEHIAKFTSMGKSALRVTFPAGTDTKPADRAPILVESGTRFKGLIQPYTSWSSSEYGVDLANENKARADKVAAEKETDG